MKKNVAFLCLGFLAGCSNQDVNETPPPVPDSIMVEVFIELHLAEARADLLLEKETTLHDSILTHFDLDQATFNEIMIFYRENPDAYHKIYSEALDKLSNERYLPDKPE